MAHSQTAPLASEDLPTVEDLGLDGTDAIVVRVLHVQLGGLPEPDGTSDLPGGRLEAVHQDVAVPAPDQHGPPF